MAEIIWADPAIQDLDAIADYVALDKPEAARRLVQRVLAAAEGLQRTFRTPTICAVGYMTPPASLAFSRLTEGTPRYSLEVQAQDACGVGPAGAEA